MQSAHPTPPRSASASPAAALPLVSRTEANQRLADKLIRGDHARTLGRHLAKEMEAEERAASENTGVAAGQRHPDTAAGGGAGRASTSPSAAARRHPAQHQHHQHHQPAPPPRSRTPNANGTAPNPVRSAGAKSASPTPGVYFRPIREQSPEEAVREKVAAVRDEHELAPSEVDFLEEVLLDALSMPRSRRTEGAAAAKYAYSPEFENGVIQRQRKELQLLVGELRERDRELNDMVAAHQRQMAAWEGDRRRCVQLEEKARRLEAEIQDRQSQIKALFQKLAEAEKAQEERARQLAQYQERLGKMATEHASTKGVVEEVEEANELMEDRIKELSSTIGLLEAREQELLTEIKNKEGELLHVHQELGDVSGRWKTSEGQLRAAEQSAGQLRQQVGELNAYITETKREVDQLRAEVSKLALENSELVESKERLQRDLMQAKKDAELAAERERRKDDLIQSQRLKQERSDAELTHLRHLYERMQQDLASLQLEASAGLCSEDMLDRRPAAPPAVSPGLSLPVPGLPPRPRSVARNGAGYPARASSAAARVANGSGPDPGVDALTRQHLEEYRARYTPVGAVLASSGGSNLARVSSLPDLSPRDFVNAALAASKQSKMSRAMNGGGL